MGSPKGKTHRQYAKEEKVKYIEDFNGSHMSMRKFTMQEGLSYGMFCRWLKNYAEEGEEGLSSHRDRCGNRYSAIHTSNSLDEIGRLQLQVAKLEADVARLKKRYLVKGSGLGKEFVTGNGRTFKSSKNSK